MIGKVRRLIPFFILCIGLAAAVTAVRYSQELRSGATGGIRGVVDFGGGCSQQAYEAGGRACGECGDTVKIRECQLQPSGIYAWICFSGTESLCTGTPQPTTPTGSGSCSGSCQAAANCGAVGMDNASGSCVSGQVCCQAKSAYLPPPEIVEFKVAVAQRRIKVGDKTRLSIKPTIKNYRRYNVRVSAEEIASGTPAKTDSANEIGIGSSTATRWSASCDLSDPAASSGCAIQGFTIDLYGLNSGYSSLKIHLYTDNAGGSNTADRSIKIAIQ